MKLVNYIWMNSKVKYYRIGASTESKVVGRKYPQLEPITGDEIEKSKNIQRLDDDFPILQTSSVYRIEKSAKLTDILSMGLYPYFALNEKVKHILETFEIRDTYFIPMKVITPSTSAWFVSYFPFSNESIELINFDETLFYITDGLGEENHGEFVIGEDCSDKLKEWRRIYKTTEDDQVLRIKKLILKNRFEYIDLFYLSPFYQSDVIVSDRIKTEFELHGITGLSFKEIDLSFG